MQEPPAHDLTSEHHEHKESNSVSTRSLDECTTVKPTFLDRELTGNRNQKTDISPQQFQVIWSCYFEILVGISEWRITEHRRWD